MECTHMVLSRFSVNPGGVMTFRGFFRKGFRFWGGQFDPKNKPQYFIKPQKKCSYICPKRSVYTGGTEVIDRDTKIFWDLVPWKGEELFFPRACRQKLPVFFGPVFFNGSPFSIVNFTPAQPRGHTKPFLLPFHRDQSEISLLKKNPCSLLSIMFNLFRLPEINGEERILN